MKPTRAMPLVGSLLIAGGCAPTHLNERLAIGTGTTPSFAIGAGFDAGIGGPGSLTMRASTQRPRAAWDTLVDGSPIDGVVHGHTFRTRRTVTRRDDAYRVGAYPDPMAEGGGRPSDSLLGAVFEWGRAGIDAGVMAVRSVSMGARGGGARGVWSPGVVWKRTPSDRPRVGTIPRAEARIEGTDEAGTREETGP